MNFNTSDSILEQITLTIEVPEFAYEVAEARYHDLGEWFCRAESSCSRFQPHISVQGSFRLGTVNRPLNAKETYDLDLVCNMKHGISKMAISQAQLKHLVGSEIELYRIARRIEKELKEKHRCWCLEYADSIGFHMDILPSVPEVENRRVLLREAMVNSGTPLELARDLADLSVSITDNRHPYYTALWDEWPVSNPLGFARWFESRMKLATILLEKRLLESRVARIDDLPVFRWKTPLQRSIQLLKRHRDIFFSKNPDLKPASNILTTLAAQAYQGEGRLTETLVRCLNGMEKHLNATTPRVPNPVSPSEDFADKWRTPEGRTKNLEANFWNWLTQAKADFMSICESSEPEFIAEQTLRKLGTRLNSEELLQKIAWGTPLVARSPRVQTIKEQPARPWAR